MTSENAAQGAAQGTETTSENTSQTAAGLFSSAAGEPAPERARPPKSTTTILADPFTVSQPRPIIADTDPQPAAADFLRR